LPLSDVFADAVFRRATMTMLNIDRREWNFVFGHAWLLLLVNNTDKDMISLIRTRRTTAQ
jgi:hypothetical protein